MSENLLRCMRSDTPIYRCIWDVSNRSRI